MILSDVIGDVIKYAAKISVIEPPRNISFGEKNIVEKAVEKVIDTAEDVFDATKSAAKNAIEAFEDAAEFMESCFSSVGDHNIVSDNIYVSVLKSKDVSSKGANWMDHLEDSRTLQSITIPGDVY